MGLKTIQAAELTRLGADFGVDEAAIKAVLQVESSGHGFSPVTGKMIIRFESLKFQEATKILISDLHNIQSDEYAAYTKAKAADPVKAMLNTSFGIAQIMGWNFSACGYKSVTAMVDAFDQSEYFQISGMLMFIKSEPAMFSALKRLDWPVFAYHYNGPKYLENHYDTHLKTAYEGAKR